MRSTAAIIAGLFFAIAALIHLVRLYCPFDVIIGSYAVPLWISAVFFIIGGLLSGYLLRGCQHLTENKEFLK